MELAGQLPQRGPGIGIEDLHGHVVRARLQVRGDPAGDRRRVAVHRQRVEQRVAAAVGQVGLGPAQPEQVAAIVGQAQVQELRDLPLAKARTGLGDNAIPCRAIELG